MRSVVFRPASFALALALALAAVCACTRRATPYHFRAPLVSSVRPDERPLPASAADAVDERQPRARSVVDLSAPHRVEQDAHASLAPADAARAEHPDLGAARVARTRVAAGQGVAESLRAMVGQRDQEHTHLQFAMNALAAIGVTPAPEVRALEAGADLLSLAQERDALEPRSPLPGDLVVFDRTDGATPASLIGVVVAVALQAAPGGEPEGATVEFVYLARGIVRRGYVTPSTPALQRDAQGRARNTFVRHLTGKDNKNDDFLAGRLFRTYIRVDRLPQ